MFKKILTGVMLAAFTFVITSNAFLVKAAPGGTPPVEDCATYIDAELASTLSSYVLIAQVLAIILAIVLGIVDFTKAVISEDGDLKKGASKKFIRRIIVVVLILFVPSLVKFVLFNFGIVTTDPLCNIAMALIRGL